MYIWPQSQRWVCVDRSQSGLQIWTLQFYSILLCKSAPTLSGCTRFDWPLHNIYLVVFKPFLCSFRVIVFLENKYVRVRVRLNILSLSSIPSSSRISLYFGAFILPSTFTSLPEPAAKKHPHSMMLPPPCFMLGRVCLCGCAVFGGLIWLKKLLPVDLGVSHQPFREL